MSWLGRLFGKKKLEAELDQELRFHLEAQARDLVDQGLSPAEAARRSAIALGGLEQVKEDTRDARGTRWVEDLLNDTRFALRLMRRSPGFTLAAVLTLGIGIGANTAVYSAVNGLLLRTVPIPHAEQLVSVKIVGLDDPVDRFSFPAFTRLAGWVPNAREAEFAAMTSRARMYFTQGGDPEPVITQLVSGNWFPMLGVGAVAGRALGPADNVTLGGHPVAVLSHAYWTKRFGQNPAVVGSTVRFNGLPVTIIGVAEPGFFGLTLGQSVDAWLPLMMQHELRYRGNASATDGSDETKAWAPQEPISWLTIVGRLEHPVEMAQLTGRLDQHFRTELNDKSASADTAVRRYRMRQHLALVGAAHGLEGPRDEFASPLTALMISVGIVLLIACANLASLLLARSAARGHEVAVRMSLGARPSRLVRQVLTESLVLALAGGTLGVLLARVLTTTLPATPVKVELNGGVLAFAAVVTLLTGLLFGAAPAARMAGGGLYETFKSGGRGVAGGDPHRLSLGRWLVIGQIALSLILVTAAGLFVRTVRNLLTQDLGFDREHVVAAQFDPRSAGFAEGELPALYQRLLDAGRTVPGVQSASLSLSGIAAGSTRVSTFEVPGQSHGPEWDNSAVENFVSPEFLPTVGMTILQGRGFTVSDVATAPRVVVINETMAKHFFGRENPIGKHFGYEVKDPKLEVVGVVRDARVSSPREEPRPSVFYPQAQYPGEYLSSLEIRFTGPSDRAVTALRAALRAADRNLPVRDVRTLTQLVEQGLQGERMVSFLAGGFGLLALLLASVGLYGVMAYSVARRTNELGVRLALGATPAEVRGLVLKDTLGLVVAGVVLGLLLLVPSVGLARSLVYGVSPRDPATMIGATMVLVVVGLLAGAIPAWRASRVDPATALRA